MNDAEAILEMFVVYERPKDYPDKFVLRRWAIGRGAAQGTEWFVLGETIEEVRAHVPLHCVRIGRDPHDEPQIVEVWL
jgi:hypothetical protein